MKVHPGIKFRQLALLTTFLGIVSTSMAAEIKLQETFGNGVVYFTGEPAVSLGTVAIPHSSGRITFIDETPGAAVPSVSIIVVEDAGYSSLSDLARDQSVTPLEIYLAYAPTMSRIPERLQQDHDLRRSNSDRSQVADWGLSPETTAFGSLPVLKEDKWADGCVNFSKWKTGFENWIGTWVGIDTKHYDRQFGAGNSQQFYGYFSGYDRIWAGVCMTSGNFMTVKMQYLDSYGNWNAVGGSYLPTSMQVHPGESYLYYNFTPNANQRRIHIYSNSDNKAMAFISGGGSEIQEPFNFNNYTPN